MKKLMFFFALSLSMNSFADIKNALDQREVEDLQVKLEEKGFHLSAVVDRYASTGVYPRCPCQAYELAFTKYVNGGNKVDKYSLSINGFGSNQKVTISKVK